jgi:hypothetical protein
MNPERMPRDGRGELPPKEFPAEIVAVFEIQGEDRVSCSLQGGDGSIQRGIPIASQSKRNKHSIGPICSRRREWFSRHRDEAGSFLSGAFCKELLDPESE